MALSTEITERIYILWDELADCDTSHADTALDRLMASLCELAGAQNASWVGAVRLPDILAGDQVHGWRPRSIRHLYATCQLEAAAQDQAKQLEKGCVDETTIRNVSFAGSFRANRLVDLVSETWFDSAYYRNYYLGLGRNDAIWVGIPVNEDAECYFGVFRESGHPCFSPADCEAVAHALRGLKWLHRQQMLSRGLLVASSPLTPVERQVLHGLLIGRSEKEIAAAQGHASTLPTNMLPRYTGSLELKVAPP